LYGVKRYDRKGEYPGLVTQLDNAIGEILNHVDDNSLVIFISDNGGDNNDNKGGLRGKKTDLFEGGIRVPMIARWRDRIPAGTVRGDFATSKEFLPTFVASGGNAASGEAQA
jgi:arylsulfatase A-like enzyme